VENGNLHFRIEGDFLLDSAGHELIRYFGGSSVVCIAEGIETLGSGCFFGQQQLAHCDFGAGSRLRSVKSRAFWKCSVGDMNLPESVCEVEGKAFLSTCHVSIANLSPAKQLLFSEWECKHRSDASAVLNLTAAVGRDSR
jgi:hypothetical protein